jgi:YihY family inner membrane protein
VERVDAARRRVSTWLESHGITSFAAAVYRKSQEDRSGSLAALITYYALLSVFPLLLLALTVLHEVLGNDPALRRDITNSALAQFPVIGTELGRRIKPLSGNGIGFAFAFLLLLWGTLGVTNAAQQAMGDVWDVDQEVRPGLLPRVGRELAFLTGLGLSVVVGTFLASVFAVGGSSWLVRVLGLLGSLAINFALYLFAFRILTPRPLGFRELRLGALVGAVAWTAVQAGGGWLVARQLRHSSELYGFFAIVLGLAAWLYLGARVSVIAAEVNVVRLRRSPVGNSAEGSDGEVVERDVVAIADAEIDDGGNPTPHAEAAAGGHHGDGH